MGSIQSDIGFHSTIDHVFEMEKMDQKLLELTTAPPHKDKQLELNLCCQEKKSDQVDLTQFSLKNNDSNNNLEQTNNNYLNLLTPDNEVNASIQENQTAALNGQLNARGPVFSPIVISGISGRFPQSNNMQEFMDNLLNGIDMVTVGDERWTPGLYGIPARCGKLKELDRFDAQFFGVHSKQAQFMDPQLRILLELTHEAILDAGVNPISIRGSNTGVFIGVTESESLYMNIEKDAEEISGYELLGSARAMFANRLSYTFDLKGPSFAIDTACSSSIVALNEAVMAIRAGHCDAAIVGAVNLCLKAKSSLMPFKLGMLSPDGACKAYDAAGNGYARSEGAAVIYITKGDLAPRRSYAEILHVRISTDGYKEQGVTFPSGKAQKQLLDTVYAEAGISPASVSYVETHGTGTSAGDPQELNSIAEVFCKDRPANQPLLIGSVKSSMGHSEPASGLCSLAKILIAMHRGTLPANLHFKSPNPNIPALDDGRFKVVDQNMEWTGGIVGLNNFGFGGSNSHLILRSNPKTRPGQSSLVSTKEENNSKPLSLLVPFSARTKPAAEFALKQLSSKETGKIDQEVISLLHEIHRQEISGHNFRGFATIDCSNNNNDDSALIDMQVTQRKTNEKPPIWFVFSGMGSQWGGMARDLMRFPVFQKSIRKSAAALKRQTNGQLNLLEILINGTDLTFENVLNSFVSITAVQIALVDLLTSLGITPDGIVGHSVGELASAYADGCLTAQQTILAAHARGEAIMTSNLEEGAMAAVGLTWEETTRRCPEGVFPACHNAQDSVTISGPIHLVRQFVGELKGEGIFAKEVNSSKMAFHSKYIQGAGEKLRASLQKIIGVTFPQVKSRSSRWISSSIPESEWNSPLALLSSAEYHVNNLLSPVLFHEAVQHVPADSIVIEIAPTGLLQAILKRSLAHSTNVAVMSRSAGDNAAHFLGAIGKLFNAGLQPQISNLYGKMEFPVSLSAGFISPLIRWDHEVSYHVAHENMSHSKNGDSAVEISLAKESDEFYKGHQIDGRIMFPATGYLLLVWKSMARSKGTTFDQLPVKFESVRFLKPTLLTQDKDKVKFIVNIFEGSGQFQISEDGSDSPTVSGVIQTVSPGNSAGNEMSEFKSVKMEMNSSDIYKELGLRGYDYSGVFRGIESADVKGQRGELRWTGNWVSFLDTILQFSILGMNNRELNLPTGIQKLTIDPVTFLGQLNVQNPEVTNQINTVPIVNMKKLNVLKCKGIEIRGLTTNTAPRKLTGGQAAPTLEQYKFVNYFDVDSATKSGDSDLMTFENSLRFLVDVAAENSHTKNLKMTEILENDQNSVATQVVYILMTQPLFQVDMAVFLPPSQTDDDDETADKLTKAGVSQVIRGHPDSSDLQGQVSTSHLTIVDNEHLIQSSESQMKNKSFLLFHSQNPMKNCPGTFPKTLKIVSHKISENGHNFYLMRKIDLIGQISKINNVTIQVNNNSFEWVEDVKLAMKTAGELPSADQNNFRINILSRNEPESGILGLVNCLKLEPEGHLIRCFFNQNCPSFDGLVNLTSSDLLTHDLLMNVCNSSGLWGSYRHFPLTDSSSSPLDSTETLNPGENAHVEILTKGDFSSLTWVKSHQQGHQNQDDLVSVFYSSLNPRDVAVAAGTGNSLNSNKTGAGVFGVEFSGILNENDQDNRKRVMGCISPGSLATRVRPDAHLLWTVPDSWSLAEAATVPINYATAFYALIVRGNLQAGQSILIENGTSGVGQAAISIASHFNCLIFTTVDSEEAKEFLQEILPNGHLVNPSNILVKNHGEENSFEQSLLEKTEGEGVDLVLSSLTGQNLLDSVRCLGENGRFLDISAPSYSTDEKNQLASVLFSRNLTFHRILQDNILDKCEETPQKSRRSQQSVVEKQRVHQLIAQGIESGVVKPIKFQIFQADQLQPAFRLIAANKQSGKVLIEIRQENDDSSSLSSLKITRAIRPTFFSPEKSYIIFGGLGGFGLELTEFLISRGAKKIALVSRSGVSTGFQQFRIQKWRDDLKVTLTFPTIDASKLTMEGAENLVRETERELKGPVGGIFNLAVVLRDSLMENQTAENFKDATEPKGKVTKLMDKVTRNPQLTPELDHFVCFSSVNCSRGKASQTTYGFSNSIMERIVEQRQVDGLPGSVIQWGAIGDTGIILNLAGGNNEMEMEGSLPQRILSCVAVLDQLLTEGQSKPIVASLVLADKKKGGKKSGHEVVTLVGGVGSILDMDLTSMNPAATLAELGMDSLMAIEINNFIKTNKADLILSMPEIRGLTIRKLGELDSQSQQSQSESKPETPTIPAESSKSI